METVGLILVAWFNWLGLAFAFVSLLSLTIALVVGSLWAVRELFRSLRE